MRWLMLASLTLSSAAVAQDADAGKAIYAAKCQACHGKTGKGDGPAARALPKKPANMAEAAFWASRSETQVAGVIANGKPGSAMRAFPMPEDKLKDLVAFLRTLPEASATP